jgi:hypothetical protein
MLGTHEATGTRSTIDWVSHIFIAAPVGLRKGFRTAADLATVADEEHDGEFLIVG